VQLDSAMLLLLMVRCLAPLLLGSRLPLLPLSRPSASRFALRFPAALLAPSGPPDQPALLASDLALPCSSGPSDAHTTASGGVLCAAPPPRSRRGTTRALLPHRGSREAG